MKTAGAVVQMGFVRLSDAIKKASKRLPFVIDGEMVFSHLSGTAIGREPSDPDDQQKVPRSLLQSEVMQCIEMFIGELRPHEHCAKLELGAFTTGRNAKDPAVDARLLVTFSYHEVAPEALGTVYTYRFRVTAENGGEIYLSGTFELCCQPR